MSSTEVQQSKLNLPPPMSKSTPISSTALPMSVAFTPSTSATAAAIPASVPSSTSTATHGLFSMPTSSQLRNGLMSMPFGSASMDLLDGPSTTLGKRSMHLEYFQASPSLIEEGITGLSSFSRDWALMQSKDFRDLRTDSIAQLEMILTPTTNVIGSVGARPGLVSASSHSHSSANLQSSSMDTIGSNFFQSHLPGNDGYPAIELSVPSMDSMDSIFHPSDQSNATTPSRAGKASTGGGGAGGKTRLKWSSEMVRLSLDST